MAGVLPFGAERVHRVRYAAGAAREVRETHLLSLAVGTFVAMYAPDMLVGAALGVASVKSVKYAARQVALLGIALWVNK